MTPPPPPPPAERLESLARHCGARGWAAAYGVLRHAEDARDAVQQALVAAARKPDCIPVDDPWPWFRRVVFLEARNLRRKRRPRTNLEDVAAWGPTDGSAAGPDDQLDRAEVRRALQAAIRRLPAVEREIVLLTQVAGWSHATAADVLGMPRATLTWHLVRARDRLKRHLCTNDAGISAGLAALAPAVPLPGGGFAANTSATLASTWGEIATTLLGGTTVTTKWAWLGGIALSVGLGAAAGVGADRAGWLGASPDGGAGVTHEASLAGRPLDPSAPMDDGASAGVGLATTATEPGGSTWSALRAENARLGAELADVRQRLERYEHEDAASRPTFTFGKAGQLDGVRDTDWAVISAASEATSKAVREVAAYKARGEAPPRDLLVGLQKSVETMRTYEYAVLDRLPTSAKFNGEFTHPITVANLVAGALAAAGLPLTESQVATIGSLGETFEREHDATRERLASALRTERILAEVRLKARFVDDLVELLDAEQRAIVAPPETRHVAGLDLLCPTLMVIHTSPVLGEADADAIVDAARNLLAKRLELAEADRVLLDDPLATWRASWAPRLLEPAPKARAANYTLAQAIDAGESTLALYRDLLSNPELSEAARKQLADDPGFLVPRILTP
ncbi:MAG: RNA polymerase sigma factor [Planctomycetota bacterium]